MKFRCCIVGFTDGLKGSGFGPFPYKTVDEAMAAIPESFNLKNPPLRGKYNRHSVLKLRTSHNKSLDGFYTPAAAASPSWLVIRYQGKQTPPCPIDTLDLTSAF